MDELDYEAIRLAHYRPWTMCWFRTGLKLGPLTVFTYRFWPQRRIRLSWTWMCGQEHRLF